VDLHLALGWGFKPGGPAAQADAARGAADGEILARESPGSPRRRGASIRGMKTSIGIDITGCVNNANVNVQGTGWLDPDQGRLELELEADRAPAHWDLALLPILGFDPLLAMAAGVIPVPAEGDLPATFRSRADLFDENDREMGEMVLSGEVSPAGDGIEVRGQLLRCKVRFEMGERVAAVEAAGRIAAIPAGPDRHILTRFASLDTSRGNAYWATCSSRVQGAVAEDYTGKEAWTLEMLAVELERPAGGKAVLKACTHVCMR